MKKISYFLAMSAIIFALASCNDNAPDNGGGNNEEQYTILPVIDGCLPGVFTVSADKKVHFSKGNLCYNHSVGSNWSFLPHQYSYLGKAANENINYEGNHSIDLFGWGTANDPLLSSQDNNDYPKQFTDWGDNRISNGGNEEKQWRTLTRNEWYYLFFQRKDYFKLAGFGKIKLSETEEVNGLFILPDNYWEHSVDVSFTPISGDITKDLGGDNYVHNEAGQNFTINQYTLQQWELMENAGVVFLPAAGVREGTTVKDVMTVGDYWGAGANEYGNAPGIHSNNTYLQVFSGSSVHVGQSVRLVH